MIKSLTIAETMSVILNGNSKDTYTEGAQRSSPNILRASKWQREKPIQYFLFFENSKSLPAVDDKNENK